MKKSKKVLIISGGSISNDFVSTYLEKESFDYIIAADSGLLAVDELGLSVDCILGDFDSVPQDIIEKYKNKQKTDKSIKIRKYKPVKDYTDTQIAIEEAINLQGDEIVILGGTGTRLDHTLSNIYNLLKPLEKSVKCTIIDGHNKLYLIDKPITISKQDVFGAYVTLLALTKVVKGVSLTGFKYNLTNKDIYLGDSLGISNEIIEDEAHISLDSGILIVVESQD